MSDGLRSEPLRPACVWEGLGAHFSIPFMVRSLPQAEVVWLNMRWWLAQGWAVDEQPVRAELERWLAATFGVIADPDATDGTLRADRYGATRGSLYGGSGRCGYIGAFNAKGIGRTPLVRACLDNDHSDGRVSMAEAIREAVAAEVAGEELPYGSVPVAAIIATDDEVAGEAIVVRPNFLRPAHFERSVFFGTAGTVGSDQHRDALRTRDAVTAAEREGGALGFPGLETMICRLGEQIGAGYAHRLWQGRFLTSNAAVTGALADFGSFRAVPSWRRYFGLSEELFGAEASYLARAAASVHASFAKYGQSRNDDQSALTLQRQAGDAIDNGFDRAVAAVLNLSIFSVSERGDLIAMLRSYFRIQQRSVLQIGHRHNWRLPWIYECLVDRSRVGNPAYANERRLLVQLEDLIGPPERARRTWAAFQRWTRPRPELYYEHTAIMFARLARQMRRRPNERRALLDQAIVKVLSKVRRVFPALPAGFTVQGQTCLGHTTVLYGLGIDSDAPVALLAGTGSPRGNYIFGKLLPDLGSDHWIELNCSPSAMTNGCQLAFEGRTMRVPPALQLYSAE